MKKNILKISVLILSLLLDANDVWARAGGGGGGHGGGGGGHGGGHGSGGFGGGGHSYGGGGGYNSYGGGGDHIYTSGNSFGTFVFILFVAIIILILVRNFKSQDYSGIGPEFHEPNALPIPLAPEQIEDLKKKAQFAFLTIQSAWSQKKTASMRRFITDGVYQRFNAQFTMMNLLDQTNFISDVKVIDTHIINYSTEGSYECAQVKIQAVATDQFISKKFPQLNSPGGRESFFEVWSFIRRLKDEGHTDIYNKEQCPKCSGPLTDKLMETARCPYCGVYINSGEFDWVLSEITQIENYSPNGIQNLNSPELKADLEKIRSFEPSFSIQVLEDRASNAFLQILIGLAEKNIDSLRRFSTPDFYHKIEQMLSQQDFIYGRLYLKSVDLIDFDWSENNFVQAHIAVSFAFQRVQINGDQALLVEDDVVERNSKMLLIHKLSSQQMKGTIYANACPQCGGTQKDSLNSTCEYCGSVLNDPRGDWIVEDLNWNI